MIILAWKRFMMRRQSILEKIQNLAPENKEVPCVYVT